MVLLLGAGAGWVAETVITAPSGPTSTPPGAGIRGCTTEWVEDLAFDGEALGRSRGGLTSKIHDPDGPLMP